MRSRGLDPFDRPSSAEPAARRCCRRNVVVDLSTQRSIAVASFHTGTPSAFRACRMPSRRVTASKLPSRDGADDRAVRQSSRAFRASARTARRVSKSHRFERQQRPSRCRAWRTRRGAARACQSRDAAKSTMRARNAPARRPDRRQGNEASRSSAETAPARNVSPLSSAVTATSAGLNSIGSMA